MSFPKIPISSVPVVTAEQMVEVDRAMIEDLHILLIQMMENAGRNLAHLARELFLSGQPKAKRIAVMAGPGGNGGGALVCARRLSNWGANVDVFVTRSDDHFADIPAHQLRIVRAMKMAVNSDSPDNTNYHLIVDGVIGYSLRGAPRGGAAELIEWANHTGCPILSLDAPSGIDTTSGTSFDPSITAAATMTLALPKRGLLEPAVRAQVGRLFLADISVPPALYNSPELQIHVEGLFATSDVLELV